MSQQYLFIKYTFRHVSIFLYHHQGVLTLCTNAKLPDDDIKMSKHVAVYIL